MDRPTNPEQLRSLSQDGLIARWRPIVSRVAVPLLAVGLFALALWTIHHSVSAIRFSQVRHEIVAIPGNLLLLALGLTASSFLALAFQDYVALWSTGKRISFLRAALGSFIAQSVAHSTGFSILIGGALRCRYYMSEGLSFADTMKVQLSFSGTFGMATCILLGLSFAFMLLPVAALGSTMKVSSWWLVAFYAIYTCGELYVSPIGLALVTKVAPARVVSMMMGVLLFSYAVGNFIAGYIGSLWEKLGMHAFFILAAIIPISAGLAIWAVSKPLRPVLERKHVPDALTPGVA